MTWTGSFTGFTGCYATLNGSYTLTQVSGHPCRWAGSIGSTTAIVVFDSSGRLNFELYNATAGTGYRSAALDGNCCDVATLTLTNFSCSSAGTPLPSIELTPSCSPPPYGCPDLLVATPLCCDPGSVGSGSGASGGIGGPTECCPGRTLPSTLYAHFSDGSGCNCVAGAIVAIMGGPLWTGSATVCGHANVSVNLNCLADGTWSINGGDAALTCAFGPPPVTPAADDCDPLQIVFANVPMTGCCTGTVTITILETP